MIRKLLTGLIVLGLSVGCALAAETKGTVRVIDGEKMTILVAVGGKDVTLKFTKDTKFVSDDGAPVQSGYKARRFQFGSEVTITTEKKGDEEIVTQLKGKTPKK